MNNCEHNPEEYLLRWLSSILKEEDLSSFQKTICSKPGRITSAYKELFQGYEVESAEKIISVTEVLEETIYQGLVSGLNIPFMSFCEHHFLPFHGTIDECIPLLR